MANKKQKLPALNTCGHGTCVQSFIDTGKRRCLYGKTKLYLYRFLENDDDGDPYDHGVVRAASRTEACKLLRARVKYLGHESARVRLYHLDERSTPGVLNTVNVHSDHVVSA